MRRFIGWALAMVGLRIVYVCEWGEFTHRYDSIDRAMGRPIHDRMGVAPPWATACVRAAR